MDNNKRIRNDIPAGAVLNQRVGGQRPAADEGYYGAEAGGYTQMSLRPMTQMRPKERPRAAAPRQSNMQRPQRPTNQRPTGQRPAPQRPAGQRPASQRPTGQRPPYGEKRMPPQKKARVPQEQRGWVLPEGSAIYSADGIMYERRPKRTPPPKKKKPAVKKKRINKEALKKSIKSFLVRFAIVFLVVAVLSFWRYRSEFCAELPEMDGETTFSMGDMGSYTEDSQRVYKNGVAYIDMTEVSKWMGMVSVGSISCMRFICTEEVSPTSEGVGGEEYVIFTDGSVNCVVNGINVTLEDVCRVVDGNVWVPLSFVEDYVNGIEVSQSANSESVELIPRFGDSLSEEELRDGEEAEETPVPEISFKVKSSRPLDRVEYPQ